MAISWKELKNLIEDFSEEQLNQNVTIYIRELDEYYGASEDYPLVESAKDCDVLDLGSKYLVI
jgi:hypothetical protein